MIRVTEIDYYFFSKWDEVKGNLESTINKAEDAYKKDIVGKDNIISDVVI